MTPRKKIEEAQKYLTEMGIDGWLLYDFQGSNGLARYFLDMTPTKMLKRRFFYWIPAKGEPVRLVHAIETESLDRWPGAKRIYLSWKSLNHELETLLRGSKKVAMEYSPNNAIPYVSKVDAGTVELVRSFGVEVVSSGNFLPHFTSVLDDAQAESLVRAGELAERIVNEAWDWIRKHLKIGKSLTEYDVQQKIIAEFEAHGLVTDHDPIVAVNANSANPHYAPSREGGNSPIRKGDWILIDLWCKEKGERTVFADIARVAIAAKEPTAKQQELFQIVKAARIAATDLVKKRFHEKKRVEGCEVDDAARAVIEKSGYGKQFIHKTGHSIDVEVHGSGAHMDNLEMHDDRPILLSTCFSVEPGIYLEGYFGVRLEYDLYVDKKGTVHIIGGVQEEIVTLF